MPDPFGGGFGRIWDIAVFIVEATGHVNPEKVKRMGGAQAEAVRKQEQEAASIRNHFLGKGVECGPLTQQGQFDQRVQRQASALVWIAQEENWMVVDSDGVPLKPPRESGFVKVQRVHDWYLKSDAKGHDKIAEALTAAHSAPHDTDSKTISSGASSVRAHSTIVRRKRQLTPLIKLAMSKAADPHDWTSGWDNLVAMAEADVKLSPLLGFTPGEGVKYTKDGEDNSVAWLTKNAFRKRIERATPRQPQSLADESGR
jgi:hypothetical protein